jgi:hypothetical protein
MRYSRNGGFAPFRGEMCMETTATPRQAPFEGAESQLDFLSLNDHSAPSNGASGGSCSSL